MTDKVKTKSKKDLLFRVAAICIGILLGLVLLEIAFRVYRQATIHYWTYFVPSEELGWTLKPDINEEEADFGLGRLVELKTNSLGLRDSVEPDEIPPDAIVVAVQGDSDVAGHGLAPKETLSRQLELYLRENAPEGKEFYVLNFGCSGYDLHHYVIQAEELQKKYRLDVLVMIFNMSNDYGMSTQSYPHYLPRPYFVLDPDGTDGLTLKHPKQPTAERVYGYDFIDPYNEYDHLIEGLNSGHFAVDVDSILSHSYLFVHTDKALGDLGIWRREYPEEEVERAKIYSPFDGTWAFTNPYPEPYASHRALVSALLARWDRVAPPGSFVVLLPGKTQVSFTLQQEHVARAEKFNLGELDFDYPSNLMEQLATDAGVEVFNPLPLAKEIPEPDAFLYIADDSHMNWTGNELLAAEIGKMILSRE